MAEIFSIEQRPKLRIARFLLILAVLVVLPSCKLLPKKIPGTSPTPVLTAQQLWLEHQAKILRLQSFSLKGRLGIRLPDEGATASLNWTHGPQEFEFRLDGPLGKGSLLLRQDASGTWVQSEQFSGRTDNLELAMHEEFGWSIPMQALPYWVRGLPMPERRHETLELNDDGRLSFLDQNGWQLQISAYKEHSGMVLPARLSLRSGDVALKLSIRTWDIGEH